ncbi:MAG: hypothetical protein RL215_2554 [Planctomycetota bacterium]
MGDSVVCVICWFVCGFRAGLEFGVIGVQGNPAGPEFGGAGLSPECEGFADVGVEGEVLVDMVLGGLGDVADEPGGGFVELFSGRVEVCRGEGEPFEVVPRRDDSF